MIDDRSIQRALRDKGFYKGDIDGDFGPKSREAAKSALLAAGLTAAGDWPAARRRIAVQQLMLADLGFYPPDGIDGRIGPDTRLALEKWQNHLRGVTPAAPDIRHQPTDWPRQADVPAFYGTQGENQVRLDLPFPMRLAWDKAVTINRMTLHRKVAESAGRVFQRIHGHYGQQRIQELRLDLFGGSLDVRRMRGGTQWSMHSWGIAIDFDPEHNQLRWGRDKASLAKPAYAAFWGFWAAEGWISLGRERNYDWMHVQAARL